MKILATINIGITGPSKPLSFKCTYNIYDQTSVVVSGHNVFKYYKIKELSEFVADHTQVNSKERDRNITTSYTCHAWMIKTGKLILCTENEILLLNDNGEYNCQIHIPTFVNPQTG